jgi:hypothetical protein
VKHFISEELVEHLARCQLWVQMKKYQLSKFIDLINAVKVSGRTEKDLGLVLNAVTEKTYATIDNSVTNNSRKGH